MGPTDAAVSAFSGSITADVLKFHVSSNQQLPTRNGRTYVSLNDDKEVGIKVTVDTCESFAMHGVAPPAKMAKITGTTRCKWIHPHRRCSPRTLRGEDSSFHVPQEHRGCQPPQLRALASRIFNGQELIISL